ncbi:MAG: (Fe-S)-binding protein [Deltaproteobacteria bacterium]|nr:(Fe-S)-binding protein [Deltaproteobacteria bacterium]
MKLGDHKKDLGRCTYCPKLCRFCCPTAEVEHRETVTPWFKMSLAERLRSGQVSADADWAEVFYHCFGCLHCRTHCRHEVDVPGALIQARAICLEENAAPAPVLDLLKRQQSTGNPFGEDDLRKKLHAVVDEDLFVPEAQVVVFAGCQAIQEASRYLLPLQKLIKGLKLDYVGVYDGEQLCCGAPLWQAGDFDGFRAHAEQLRRSLSEARTVICPCPTCAYVLGTVFAQFEVPLSAEVLTLDAFLGPILARRKPARRLKGSFTYHDPCYLTRYLDRGKEVRELLALVLEEDLIEPPYHGEDATCCGGGGLVPHILPNVAQGAAELRAGQLAQSGAEKVITACPGCLRQLEGASSASPYLTLEEILLESYL